VRLVLPQDCARERWIIEHLRALELGAPGDGSRRIEPGTDRVIQSNERIFLADWANERSTNDAKEGPAVGFCRFGDLTKPGTTVKCVALTQAGLYEGAFVTDGRPPILDECQVRR
jgi:hypothetical protein